MAEKIVEPLQKADEAHLSAVPPAKFAVRIHKSKSRGRTTGHHGQVHGVRTWGGQLDHSHFNTFAPLGAEASSTVTSRSNSEIAFSTNRFKGGQADSID